MRTSQARRGFTLIELLTVIAIIVILAAILLPVLGRVREQSTRTECMSNLHQIATAIKLYKLDERGYPLDLTERPIPPNERWFGPADAQGRPTREGPGYGLATLYPDYIQSLRTFNCGDNETDSLAAEGGQNPPANQAEAQSATGVSYNSYDGYDLPLQQLRYDRYWRDPVSALDRHYRRQLCWRYPPEDTVVTWCVFHRSFPPDDLTATISPKDKDIVLFLDGTTRLVPSWDETNPELGFGHMTLPGESD